MHVDQNKDDGKEVHQDEEKPPENKEGQGGEGDKKGGEGDNEQKEGDGGNGQKEGGNSTDTEGGR